MCAHAAVSHTAPVSNTPAAAATPLYASPSNAGVHGPDSVLRELVAAASAARGLDELLFVSEVSNVGAAAPTLASWTAKSTTAGTFAVDILHCPQELESRAEYAAARAAEYEQDADHAARFEAWLCANGVADRALVLGRLQRCTKAVAVPGPLRHQHNALLGSAALSADELLTLDGLSSVRQFARISAARAAAAAPAHSLG